MANSAIKFEVLDYDRFGMLTRVFDELRAAKQSRMFPDGDYWQSFFDQEALSYFWWPTDQEVLEFKQQCVATAVSERLSDPVLQGPWLSALCWTR
jgi:hypothetical protein